MLERLSSIQIVVEADALRAFVPALAERLRSHTGVQVDIEIMEAGAAGHATALDTLLSLERMVLRRGKSCWSDPIGKDMLTPLLAAPSSPSPDILIDLTARTISHATALVLRPLYDGAPGEQSLASALFFNGTPDISIVSQDGSVLAEGVASLEAASGIGGAMEAVWSRVALLLAKVLAAPDMEGAGVSSALRHGTITRSNVIRYGAKTIASAAARAAYRLCCHAPHWRVGWRHHVDGQDVWARRDLGGARWQVLRDPVDHFYADPFPFHHQGKDFIFLEDLDHKTGKGIISVIEFDVDGRPGPTVPVIEEPWHLSYPFLIEDGGQIWMIPEASLSGAVGIYRAVDFPYRWRREGTLLSGLEAADATIVRHDDGLFYIFAVVREGVGGYSDTLSIWHSQSLFGPWEAHGSNPVLVDDRSARPAGNFVIRDGVLMRPVQDCRNGYGAALALARIDRLAPDRFEQTVETHLGAGGPWPGRKIHTLNGNGRLEVIDGSIIRPKLSAAAALVERRYRP